jgi:tRNA (guanine37-N1)-methyltransferase
VKGVPKCIRVDKREGEEVRNRLADSGLLDTKHKIARHGEHLDIPVLCDSFEGREAFDSEAEETEGHTTDYKEILDLPDWLNEELPRSYDIIGDVAIIKLSDALVPYRERIGEAMMEATPSLRAVMLDSGVKGEFRIRELKKIAGTGTSETVHKEFGVRMTVDPSLVYFNPRLATERARVALSVKDGEKIIDMFAGVAPFPLVISKLARPEVIYAVDLNPEAERFMRTNIENNHAGDIVPIIGDARSAVKGLPKADRIIMNLPQSSDDFLDSALEAAKVGAVIHMHRVLERAEAETFAEKLTERMRSAGHNIRITRTSELKTYSPSMSVYVFDIVKD